MEKIQVSNEKLIPLFKKLKSNGIALICVWIGATIALIGTGLFVNFALASPIAAFIGFMFMGFININYANVAMKKLESNELEVYKTKCIKKRLLEYAVVENNEILSRKVKRPLKWVPLLVPMKSINVGDEIGIVKVDKKVFYAFSLNE